MRTRFRRIALVVVTLTAAMSILAGESRAVGESVCSRCWDWETSEICVAASMTKCIAAVFCGPGFMCCLTDC